MKILLMVHEMYDNGMSGPALAIVAQEEHGWYYYEYLHTPGVLSQSFLTMQDAVVDCIRVYKSLDETG